MEDNIYSARTDLALEINEEASKKEGRVKGIIVEESHDKDKNIHVTKLVITGKNGEKILGRRKGTYITMVVRIRLVSPAPHKNKFCFLILKILPL